MFAKLGQLAPSAQVRVWLGALGLGLISYLVLADKPWTVLVPDDRPMKVSEFVTKYLWIAAAINLGFTAVLAATAGWWAAPFRGELSTFNVQRSTPRWFWPLVIFAMALTAWLGWPRLGLGVWHDEATRVNNTIAGQFKAKPDGTFVYRPVKWQQTFFSFELPNHLLQTVLSRVANETWRAVAKPKGLQFSEVAIRLPGYLAGLVGLAGLAVLGWRIGFPEAGVVAAFLLAVHPWYLRYVGEARAYIFVMALMPVLVLSFLNAVERGRWRWWAAFAAVEFCLIYLYAVSVWIVLVANVCVLAALLARWGVTRELAGQLGRWLVSGLLAAMALLQLMLPCVPQFVTYANESLGRKGADSQWIVSFLSHLLAGIPWSYTHSREPSPYLEMMPWFSLHPVAGGLIVGVFGVGLVAGGIRLLGRKLPVALVPVMLLLPGAFYYWESISRGRLFHEWYLIFILPGCALLVALGWTAVSRRAGISLGVGLGAVALFAVWTTPQRELLRSRSVQPNRESVLLTRPTLDPNDPRQPHILTATFFSPPGPYDPRIERFTTIPEMVGLMERADRENASLFINLGFLETVAMEHPAKYALVKSPALFTRVAFLPGLHPALSREVFAYVPGAVAGIDFSTLKDDPSRKSHD